MFVPTFFAYDTTGHHLVRHDWRGRDDPAPFLFPAGGHRRAGDGPSGDPDRRRGLRGGGALTTARARRVDLRRNFAPLCDIWKSRSRPYRFFRCLGPQRDAHGEPASGLLRVAASDGHDSRKLPPPTPFDVRYPSVRDGGGPSTRVRRIMFRTWLRISTLSARAV